MRSAPQPDVDPAEVVAALRAAGLRDVRSDSTTRAAYSTDASLYRVFPRAVVCPHDSDEVEALMSVARAAGVPVTARGGGTSVAGNAVGYGLVVDFSRHLNRIHAIDPEARTAVVDPGVVQHRLQLAAAPHGLLFGPDPSTSTRATIGGMIGNNACGNRTLGYGRTSDNIVGIDAITGGGERLKLTAGAASDGLVANRVREVAASDLATIRTTFGTFGRQVSGYALEHTLPENRTDLARLLVGSEGTLAVITGATVSLVRAPLHRVLVVLGYPNIAAAGDAAPTVLTFSPTACEGIDSRIVDVVRTRRGPHTVPPLPRGAAWLFVEVAGDDAAATVQSAQFLAAGCGADDAMVVTDPVAAGALWRIRADGAGLAGRSPRGLPAHAGWEDSAVPPERFGDYLRAVDDLFDEYGLSALPYGHFGDGCLHVRIDWPLSPAGDPGMLRRFVTEAAALVAGFGGSLSGEHGDGRARSELLPLMYPPAAMSLFARIKRAFDPANLLNPGVVVDPAPMDADVRVSTAPAVRRDLALAYSGDGGDFSTAVHRCTGVGKCRADASGPGSVMCPSYLATREEVDSTRGRARVLQEMINGSEVTGGWRSPEVHRALDLCLSCKGCASDCPTGVDMAAYKSEVLHQRYRGRVRPASHYVLGRLPRWAALGSRAPRLVNAVLAAPGVAPLALTVAGGDTRRRLPPLAHENFRRWFRRTRDQRRSGGHPVLLFVDTFTDFFTPEVAVAAVAVLEDAGFTPEITLRRTCCALTWITTGQLTAARTILGRTVEHLDRATEPGVPVVGLEPSCTAVLRSDSVELLDNPAAARVAASTRTLSELLTESGWQVPDLTGETIVAQPHCHHHAVMGWDGDARLLAGTGADITRVGGCCGLAGNFGVERGHYEVSVQIAEQQLLPAVDAAGSDATILADGYSCRTQLADMRGRQGHHLAQLLASRLTTR